MNEQHGQSLTPSPGQSERDTHTPAASAPDLLHAITRQRCAFCGYFFGFRDDCETCAPMYAAIAKAEGRPL